MQTKKGQFLISLETTRPYFHFGNPAIHQSSPAWTRGFPSSEYAKFGFAILWSVNYSFAEMMSTKNGYANIDYLLPGLGSRKRRQIVKPLLITGLTPHDELLTPAGFGFFAL